MRPSTGLNALAGKDVLVLDGGLATELEDRGLDLGHMLWSGDVLLNNPRAVEQVHFDYLCAGAEVIITASYQLSYAGMANAGFTTEETDRALRQSVEVAKRARERWAHARESEVRAFQPLIAASAGPYGAFLANGAEYTGVYDVDAAGLRAFHDRRLEILVDSVADLIAFETVPSLTEAIVMAELIADSPDTAAWLSFSCPDGQQLADGTPVTDAAQRILEIRPDWVALGVNCTAPGNVEPLLHALRRVTDLPLLAYPNSGEGWDAARRCWIGERDPTEFSELARRWRKAGARIIGGCCRTGPAHIASLREALT
ncbi:MAG: homocysteine S-methyltransferase [Pseudomonadota bacterium]